MGSLGRLCGFGRASGVRLLQSQILPSAASEANAGPLAQPQLQHFGRGFASAGHHGEGTTYEGLTLHKPARWHVMWGTGMCSLMWFWVMYRAYYDGEAFLYGHAVHFEHDEDHHDKEHH